MNMKKWTALLMALVCMVFFTACSSSSSGDSSSAETSSEETSSEESSSEASSSETTSSKTTSSETSGEAESSAPATELTAGTYTFMTWESDDMNSKIVASFDSFMEEHPGVVVELTAAPLSDYGTKLKTMLSSGTAPDIFMVGNDWTIQYGSSGNLYDWTEMAEADGIESIYYPGVIDNWKVDGHLYGFPGLLNTYGVFYNKTLFDEAGLSYPEVGWTYDEMLEDAKVLKESSGLPYGLVTACAFDPFTISTYAASKGDEPFIDTIVGVDHVTVSDSMKEIITKFSEAIQAGYVTSYSYDTSNVSTEFMDGKIPMMTAGQWYADEFIRNGPEDLEWGFATWPVGDSSSPSTIYDCTGWAARADIESPETVYAIIKFIHTEMYQEVLPQNPVAPAAATEYSEGYYNKLKETGHEDMVESLTYMLECENKLGIRFLDSFASEATVYITDEWGPILDGDVDVDEADTMAQEINDAIDNYYATSE